MCVSPARSGTCSEHHSGVPERARFQQHDPEDEPAVAPLDPEYFEFDCESAEFMFALPTLPNHVFPDLDLNKQQLKELLFEEVRAFVPCI